MIQISKELAIDEKANAETLYKALKEMGYRPIYNQSTDYSFARILIMAGGSVEIIFHDNKDDKKAKVRKIVKRTDDPVFPSKFETLYKARFWY